MRSFCPASTAHPLLASVSAGCGSGPGRRVDPQDPAGALRLEALRRDNPYADYPVERIYDFLSHYELPRKPGEKYEYSNLGVGLLGHLLARRAGSSYEEKRGA